MPGMHVTPLPDYVTRFESVPEAAITQLSLPALGLLVYLLRFGPTHQGPIGSLAVRKQLGLSKNKIESYARELRHEGYLWTERIRGSDGRWSAVMHVSAVADDERAVVERRLFAEQSAKLMQRAQAKPVW